MTIRLVRALTRRGIAEAIHLDLGHSRSDAADMVAQMLRHVCASLSDGNNVKVAGFGSFILRDKNERVGRNPKTGAEVTIAPRRVLTFRAATALRDAVVAADKIRPEEDLTDNIRER